MNWNLRTNRIWIKWLNHNGWIDIFVIKKTIFCVRIFYISPCLFNQILIGRARWMRNLIPHPMSTRIAYFWQTPLPQKQEIPEKHDDDVIITFFLGISYFWGSGAHQKYGKWVLVGWKFSSASNELSQSKFE